MLLQFFLSGSLVWEGDSPVVPPAGSSVEFQMMYYKKGFVVGQRVAATVEDQEPVRYHFGPEGALTVGIAVGEFVELSP